MFLGPLRQILRRGQRGQGLVEYGLITACLAFIGVAGFNALADAQKSYLSTIPKNVPAPVITGGVLYHPTWIGSGDSFPNLPGCNVYPATSVADAKLHLTTVPTTMMCNQATVYDVYTTIAQQTTPWGMIPNGLVWTLEDLSNGSIVQTMPCTLDIPGATRNSCSSLGSTPFSYPLTNPGQTLMLLVTYQPLAGTIHFPGSTRPLYVAT